MLDLHCHILPCIDDGVKVAGYGYNYEGYYAYGGSPQLTKR